MLLQLITISLGLFVGLALGTLGGGGSTLAVPVLVFVAGFGAQEATTASLIVIGLAAMIGAVGHYRNGNVRVAAGLAFGVAGVAGSRAGTILNQSLPEQLLLLLFSALILLVAIRMYQSVSPQLAPSSPTSRAQSSTLPTSAHFGGAPVTPGEGTLLVAARPEVAAAGLTFTPLLVAKLAVAATAVGVLTGLFGVGGGFAVVPALTLLLGFNAKEAVGTSLIVIAINACMALLMRGADLAVDWSVVAPFLVTVVIGVLVGSRLATRMDADRLTRSFAVMLALVAAYTVLNALT